MSRRAFIRVDLESRANWHHVKAIHQNRARAQARAANGFMAHQYSERHGDRRTRTPGRAELAECTRVHVRARPAPTRLSPQFK